MADNLEEPQFPPDRNTSNEEGSYEKPKPPAGYVGWVTFSAFAAVSTLFTVLYTTQNSVVSTARADLKAEKALRRADNIAYSKTIANQNQALLGCSDKAISELEKKFIQAKNLQYIMSSDYNRVSKETELTKQNIAEVKKATVELKKTINSNK